MHSRGLMIFNQSYDCLIDDIYYFSFFLRGIPEDYTIGATWTVDGKRFVHETLKLVSHSSVQIHRVCDKITLFVESGFYHSMPLREFLSKIEEENGPLLPNR